MGFANMSVKHHTMRLLLVLANYVCLMKMVGYIMISGRRNVWVRVQYSVLIRTEIEYVS